MGEDPAGAAARATPLNVLFWGTPEFAVPALEAVVKAGYRVVGVVTRPDRPRGRGQRVGPPPMKREALARGIPVLQPERVADPAVIEALRALAPDVSVVAAYGKILRREHLDIPPRGSLCLHPSLLPRHRGAAPIPWTILAGDRMTGVSVFLMDEGMDTGPLLLSRETPVGPEATAGELELRLARMGADLAVEALKLWASGELTPRPQTAEGVTLAPRLTPEMARLDWGEDAGTLERRIRALDPEPGAWARLRGEPLKLFRPAVVHLPLAAQARPGEVIEVRPEGLVVAAGRAALLIREVQAPGRRRMASSAFLRGRPVRVGEVLG